MDNPLAAFEAELRALLTRAYEAGRRDGVAALVAAAGGQVASMPSRMRVRSADVLRLIESDGPISWKRLGQRFGPGVANQHAQKLLRRGAIVRVSRGVYAAAGKA